MGITRYGTRNSIRRGAADAARAASQAGFVMEAGRLKMTTVLNMDSNKIINLTNGSGAADGVAFGQVGSGGDGRSILTRTFEITRAQMVAKGATNTGTFSLFTMDANEAIRWAWVENAGSVNLAGSDTPTWIGVNVGRSGDTNSILNGSGSVNLINAGSVCDDNAIHGADFQGYGEMGDKGDPNDATTYYGEEEALKAVVTIEAPGGKQLGNLTAGGPFYVHIETVRVDTTQVEASS